MRGWIFLLFHYKKAITASILTPSQLKTDLINHFLSHPILNLIRDSIFLLHFKDRLHNHTRCRHRGPGSGRCCRAGRASPCRSQSAPCWPPRSVASRLPSGAGSCSVPNNKVAWIKTATQLREVSHSFYNYYYFETNER